MKCYQRSAYSKKFRELEHLSRKLAVKKMMLSMTSDTPDLTEHLLSQIQTAPSLTRAQRERLKVLVSFFARVGWSGAAEDVLRGLREGRFISARHQKRRNDRHPSILLPLYSVAFQGMCAFFRQAS